MSNSIIPAPIKDFDVEVALDNIAESKVIHIFGRTENAGAALGDIWSPGTIRTWLTVASTIVAVSTSVNDTAAGTGARVLIIEGLDASFDAITEEITMNGTSNSTATINSYIRVNRVVVKDSGIYGATDQGTNIGTISINAGATLMAEIDVDTNKAIGVTSQTHFTVPANKQVIIRFASINVNSKQSATIYGMIRNRADIISAPFGAVRTFFIQDGLNQPDNFMPRAGILVDEKSDIWFACVSSATTDIDIDYEMILRDK